MNKQGLLDTRARTRVYAHSRTHMRARLLMYAHSRTTRVHSHSLMHTRALSLAHALACTLTSSHALKCGRMTYAHTHLYICA